MRAGQRGLFTLAAVATVAASVAVSPALAVSASKSGINARVLGTFTMHAYVTTAVNVRGEHVGQKFIRTWKIVPKECHGSICKLLSLDRQISHHRHEHISLDRIGPGKYRGNGVFSVALKCQGKVYKHGSHVPYVINLTVHRADTIQGIRFAHSLRATYYNSHRTDYTPCPLGASHDAGRYWGHVTSPPPQPPVASFSTTVNPNTGTATFTDTSHRTADGRKIVSFSWNFGDPGSGSANQSSQRSPTHHFSAPGTYQVKLTIVDRNGLSSTTTQSVTVPGPQAAFTDAPTGTPGTFSFTDRSRKGAGGTAIVAWHWNFGDPGSGAQNTSSAQDPSHTFSAHGTYSVTLTVTDAKGRKSSVTHPVKY